MQNTSFTNRGGQCWNIISEQGESIINILFPSNFYSKFKSMALLNGIPHNREIRKRRRSKIEKLAIDSI